MSPGWFFSSSRFYRTVILGSGRVATNPARKIGEIWIVAAVTYGVVAALAIAAVVVYYSWSPGEEADKARPIAVGSLWVPAYPGAVVVGHSVSGNGEVTLRVKTQDSAGKLFSFYQRKLKGGRFRLNTFKKDGEGGTIRASRLDGKAQILVTIIASPDGSEGTITALEKR